MGVIAYRLRTLDRSLVPPFSMSRNFPAHVSAESPFNISPNPLEVIPEVCMSVSLAQPILQAQKSQYL